MIEEVGSRMTMTPEEWKQLSEAYNSVASQILQKLRKGVENADQKTRFDNLNFILMAAGTTLHLVAQDEEIQKTIEFCIIKIDGEPDDEEADH